MKKTLSRVVDERYGNGWNLRLGRLSAARLRRHGWIPPSTFYTRLWRLRTKGSRKKF